MDFAKRLMQKQGWTEGSGLGKNEDGRSEAIKVNIKMDKKGVGHDPGKEFTDHWWLRVFNDAAQKVGKKDKVTEELPEEMLEKKKKTEEKKSFYKGFIQASTLANGVEKSTDKDDSSSEEEGNSSSSVPTLEDIHKFCGGATGHKAARHGIMMVGKLERVTKHEKNYEEQLRGRVENNSEGSRLFSHEKITSSDNHHASEEGSDQVRKKKKKRKNKISEETTIIEAVEMQSDKVKRKKRKKDNPELIEMDEISTLELKENPVIETNGYGDDNVKKSKRKRKKDRQKDNSPLSDSHVDLCCSSNAENSEGNAKKKKKKKREINDLEIGNDVLSQDNDEDNSDSVPKKKKKRKKSKQRK